MKRYITYLMRNPALSWKVWKVGIDDSYQFAWLSWLEMGRPEEFSFDVLNRLRFYIRKYAHRWSKEVYYDDDLKKPESQYILQDNSKGAFLRMVLEYYENHTANETIRFFNLPDNRRIRKLLSRCVPKVERKSGKPHGKRRKIYTDSSYEELKKTLPRATAWRASKRGWITVVES